MEFHNKSTPCLVDEAFIWSLNISIIKQEHPRGSIVEPQGLHQDGLNSLSYNGLKTTIIIAHVYDIF